MKIQLESQADLQFLQSLYLQHLQPHISSELIEEYLLQPLQQNIQLLSPDSKMGVPSLDKVSELIHALATAKASPSVESLHEASLRSPTLLSIPELQPGWKSKEWREQPLPGSTHSLENLNALLKIQ
jgi:hypothetical protein